MAWVVRIKYINGGTDYLPAATKSAALALARSERVRLGSSLKAATVIETEED